jgi:hypothetical protein
VILGGVVEDPTWRWRLDAGPKGALIAWLWLARDACSLDRYQFGCDARRVNALALVEIHLAGGIASVFPLRTKPMIEKAKKYFFWKGDFTARPLLAQRGDLRSRRCLVRRVRAPFTSPY